MSQRVGWARGGTDVAPIKPHPGPQSCSAALPVTLCSLAQVRWCSKKGLLIGGVIQDKGRQAELSKAQKVASRERRTQGPGCMVLEVRSGLGLIGVACSVSGTLQKGDEGGESGIWGGVQGGAPLLPKGARGRRGGRGASQPGGPAFQTRPGSCRECLGVARGAERGAAENF